jgi:hypothetical protein
MCSRLLSDSLPDQLISGVVHATGRVKWHSATKDRAVPSSGFVHEQNLGPFEDCTRHASHVTQRVSTTTLPKKSYQISCFSPAEKFSPPSETGESRFRKTLTLTSSCSFASTSSLEGMRWTRRNASYCKYVSGRWTTKEQSDNFGVFILFKYVQRGTKSATQNRWVLYNVVSCIKPPE